MWGVWGGGGGTVQGPVKEQQPDVMSHRGDSSPQTSPPPETKVTIVGKKKIYDTENLIGPFWYTRFGVPDPPPPPAQKTRCA